MQSAGLLQHFNLTHCSVSQFILSRFLLPAPALLVTSHVTLESRVSSLVLTFLNSEGRGEKKPLQCWSLQPVTWLLGDKARGSLYMRQPQEHALQRGGSLGISLKS